MIVFRQGYITVLSGEINLKLIYFRGAETIKGVRNLKWTKALASLMVVGLFGGFLGTSYAESVYPVKMQEVAEVDGGELVFPEDTASSWAVEDIYDARIYGLMNSKLGSNITSHISREEAAIVGLKLYESLVDGEVPEVFESKFQDTDSQEVRLANHIGIVNGVSENSYRPDEKITRQDFALIMKNVIEAVEVEFAGKKHLDEFTDRDQVSPYAVEALDALVSNDIVNGRSQDMVYPMASVTKEESLVMAKRIFERINDITGESSKGLFYKVSNGENELYLLGSVHIVPRHAYPMTESIRRKLKKADILAVEGDTTDENQIIELVGQYAFLEEGESTSDYVSDETYQMLEEFFDMSQMNNIKPWYFSLILESKANQDNDDVEDSLEELLYSYVPGIDEFLIDKSKMTNRQVVELEGLEYQLNMFDNMSIETQEYILRSMLEFFKDESAQEELDSQSSTMLDFWKLGDEEGLGEIIGEGIELMPDDYNEGLWHIRDRRMADKIDGYMKDLDNTYFVVVGAGHLVTNDSVVDHLRDKGYNVEKID